MTGAITEHPAKLFDYFETIGTLSVAAWVLALAIAALVCRSRHRTRFLLGALALAVAGVVLAGFNSDRVSEIRVDRTRELEDLHKEQVRRQQEEVASRKRAVAGVRFAEDGRTDALDLAGVKDDKERERLGKISEEQAASRPNQTQPADGSDVPGAEGGSYTYRQSGRQQRDPAAVRKNTDFLVKASEEARVRMMPQADVHAANQLDRFNLLAAKWTLFLVLGMMVFDYLSRFNRTFDSLLPLPIGGRLIDTHFRKTRSVLLDASKDGALKKSLAAAVRKGETFIYFGPADPWQGRPPARLPFGCRPLPMVVYDHARRPLDGEWVFESAWFGWYCFVVLGEQTGLEVVGEVLRQLKVRRRSRSWAAHTVNLAWALPTTLPRPMLKELLPLCRDANFKLLLSAPAQQCRDLAPLFEELRL